MTQLFELQKWFGALIAQPLQNDHTIASKTPFGTDVKEEANKYITPSPTLQPHQRIELYHQQYWWRLLKCLQENFPMVTRLYGYEAFNQQIGTPYLSQNPPDHWALCRLGQTLPNWLEDNGYSSLDSTAAHIDAATQRAFWTGTKKPVDFSAFSEKQTLSTKLFLQPHVHLFELSRDLFTFRNELLKEGISYWRTHPLPTIREGLCFFALYRNPKNEVRWKELMVGEYTFLTLFKKGATIQEACSVIQEEGEKPFQEASEFMPLWFREWTFLKWFQEV